MPPLVLSPARTSARPRACGAAVPFCLDSTVTADCLWRLAAGPVTRTDSGCRGAAATAATGPEGDSCRPSRGSAGWRPPAPGLRAQAGCRPARALPAGLSASHRPLARPSQYPLAHRPVSPPRPTGLLAPAGARAVSAHLGARAVSWLRGALKGRVMVALRPSASAVGSG